MVGWLEGGREGDPEAFLFLLLKLDVCLLQSQHQSLLSSWMWGTTIFIMVVSSWMWGTAIFIFHIFYIFILGYSYFSKRICITLDYFRFRFS